MDMITLYDDYTSPFKSCKIIEHYSFVTLKDEQICEQCFDSITHVSSR